MKNMSKTTPHHTSSADVVSIANKFHRDLMFANPIPTFIYVPFAAFKGIWFQIPSCLSELVANHS